MELSRWKLGGGKWFILCAKPQTVSVLSARSTNQQHPDIRIPLELTVQDWSLPAPSHTRDETVAFNQHSGQSAAKTAVDGVGPIAVWRVSKVFAASHKTLKPYFFAGPISNIFFFQSTYSTKVKWKGLLPDQCVGVKVVLYYPQYTKRGRRSLSCLPVISCLKTDEYLHFRAQVNFRVSQNNFCFFRAKGSHNLSWEKIWSINHFGPKGSKIGQQVWKMVPLIPEK